MINYITICLIFGLTPLIIEWYFHGQILKHYGKLQIAFNLISILAVVLIDPFAFYSRFWTVNQEKILGIFIFGLPIEEYLWTILTVNNLINVTLILCYFTDHTMRFRQNFFKNTQKR